jgi:hypothetical protein
LYPQFFLRLTAVGAESFFHHANLI